MKIGKRFSAAFLAALLTISAFSGCHKAEEITSGVAERDYPITVAGVTIQKEPEGVAVLSPNVAEVILAMGYEVSLKAKSEDCTQSDLSVLPNVKAVEPQAIKDAGASVVLTDKELSQDAADALKKAGLTVVTFKPASSREDLDRLYQEVGSVLKGGQIGYQHGTETAENIFYTIDDVTRVLPESKVPLTACYLYDTDGTAATGDTLAGTLVESAGFLNAVSGSKGGKVKAADLKIGNPQYIFCPKGLKSKLASAEDYKNLSAVKDGHVYEIDPSYLAYQGRGMIEGVIAMVGAVHPELLNGLESSSSPSSASSGASSAGSSSASSGSPSTITGQTLKKGDKGEKVKTLQQRLDQLGYMFLPCTGEFGDGTEQAVKDFQLLNGMTVTGVADPETIEKLMSGSAKARAN